MADMGDVADGAVAHVEAPVVAQAHHKVADLERSAIEVQWFAAEMAVVGHELVRWSNQSSAIHWRIRSAL